MSDTLHVFSVTLPADLRHTHLTRAQGEAPELPPLTDWLGAEVDTDEIELFPVKDLGDMTLGDYVTMAFAPESIPPQVARRMNALKGHALLVPERALSEEPAPGKQATLIASLPLARPDHASSLPKAELRPAPPPAQAPAGEARRRGTGLWLIGALVIIALLLAVWLG